MTKQEVRAAVLAKLAVRPNDTLWDVGAGTGSVSVEMALAAPEGRVYAAECDADACELICQNRAKFAVQNLHLTQGLAPEALADWPAPDAVFIGGSKGNLRAIVDAALAANPAARFPHQRHCAGNFAAGRRRTDRPWPDRPGHADRCQPQQGGGQPASADGK